MDRMVGPRVVLFEYEYEFEYSLLGCLRTPVVVFLPSAPLRLCARVPRFVLFAGVRMVMGGTDVVPGSVAPPGLGSVLGAKPTAHAVGYRLAVLRTWSHGFGEEAVGVGAAQGRESTSMR